MSTPLVTSHLEGVLDELVAKASQPTLAALFKKAKEQGLITTITGYGPNKEKSVPPATPQQGAPTASTTYNVNTAKSVFAAPQQ